MKKNKKKKQQLSQSEIDKRAASTSQMLAGIIHLHPAIQKIKHPKFGFTLSWKDPGKDKKSLWSIIMPDLTRRNHLIELDEVGRRVVELIDGIKSIDEISQIIAEEFDFDIDQARAALLTFTTMLIKKNIIQVTT